MAEPDEETVHDDTPETTTDEPAEDELSDSGDTGEETAAESEDEGDVPESDRPVEEPEATAEKESSVAVIDPETAVDPEPVAEDAAPEAEADDEAAGHSTESVGEVGEEVGGFEVTGRVRPGSGPGVVERFAQSPPASSSKNDAPPSGGREQHGSSSIVAAAPCPPTFPKEETMATGTTASSGTCGQLQNPGNSNPSTLTLTGQKPYLVISYSASGKDPLRLTFDNDAKMVLCPGSSACYNMKGVGEVVISFTGIAQFTWCWTDEATACCKDGK